MNLPGTKPLTEPRHVVKFSLRQHAISRAECLKLATPLQYRHNDKNAEGIHDDLEATYQEDHARIWLR